MGHTGSMRTRVGSSLACLLCFVLLAACGEDPEPESTESTAPTTSDTATPTPTSDGPPTSGTPGTPATDSPSAPAADGTRVVADDSDFGPMLFDATGQAIYLFDLETTSRPQCYDECAVAWPPVLTDGEPVAGDGLDASLLGTTDRTDGGLQVTYNDHPLYFYAHEGKGEVLCHDSFLNGGTWYVVQPDGDPAPPG